MSRPTEDALFRRSGLTPLQWELLCRLSWAPADALAVADLTARRCDGWVFDALAVLVSLGYVEGGGPGGRRNARGNPLYAVTGDGWKALRGEIVAAVVLDTRRVRAA